MKLSRVAAAPGLLLLAFNAAAGVCMVFLLKRLLSGEFNQGTTLCALHYVSCFYVFGSRARTGKGRTLSRRDVCIYAVAANLSIVTLTWSLVYNELFVYQLSKVARVPVTCSFEYLVFKKMPTRRNTVAGTAVVLGVALATFNQPYVYTHIGGVAWAVLALLSTCLQQVLVRRFHVKYNLTSRELLAQTSHAQAIALVVAGPFVDRAITGQWLWQEESDPQTGALVFLSCLLALATNWSQFACLRRFRASSFQILGHAKSLMVLVGGCVLYGDRISPPKLLGLVVSAAGLAYYATANPQEPPEKDAAAADLPRTSSGPQVSVIQETAKHPPEGNGMPTIFPSSHTNLMVCPPTPDIRSGPARGGGSRGGDSSGGSRGGGSGFNTPFPSALNFQARLMGSLQGLQGQQAQHVHTG